MTFTKESNRIYCAQDGKMLAEVTFPETAPGVVVIDHTWVDPSLRGQGTAGQLVQAVVDLLRADGRRRRPPVPTRGPGWRGTPKPPTCWPLTGAMRRRCASCFDLHTRES